MSFESKKKIEDIAIDELEGPVIKEPFNRNKYLIRFELIRYIVLALVLGITILISKNLQSSLTKNVAELENSEQESKRIMTEVESLRRQQLELQKSDALIEKIPTLVEKNNGTVLVGKLTEPVIDFAKKNDLQDFKLTVAEPEPFAVLNADMITVLNSQHFSYKKSNIDIEFTTDMETNIFKLIEYIIDLYPNYITIDTINVVKDTSLVTKDNLKNLATGSFRKVIRVQLGLTWIYIFRE